jgi:RNA polymerase sigma-70 factor (ECF subfamily)
MPRPESQPEDYRSGKTVTSDEELMSAAAGGDMDAFEELVRRHQQSAINVAYRMLGDAHRAQDTAQEAFLRILESARRYRPTAGFRTYLYRILTRLCIDIYRKRAPGASDQLDAETDPSEAPPEAVLRDERQELVRRAIDGLPGRQKLALVLQHYEDLSYEEIAVVLKCSTKAVDALLVRAKRTLKEALKDLM